MNMYGKDRLKDDLSSIGYEVDCISDGNRANYVLIKNYKIELGIFKGREVDLAIPVPNDYPRTVGPSLQIKSSPHLLDKKDTIPGKRNIINSPLGEAWRYWSFRFNLSPENPTQDLMTQINGIFRNI